MNNSAIGLHSCSTNNSFLNVDPEKENNELLPLDLLLQIFSLLPVKALLRVGSTCHHWKKISKNEEIWGSIGCEVYTAGPKANVIKKIKSLILKTKKIDSTKALGAHIYLSRVELSSLDKAYDYAKTLTITKADEVSDRFSFYDKCFDLAHSYLENNNLFKAEDIMYNMTSERWRDLIAFKVLRAYLEKDNFEKALLAMKHITGDKSSMSVALFLFIQKSKQANYDVAIKALAELSHFDISLSCARDFNQFLAEKGELDKSRNLQISFPQIIDENSSNEYIYQACNGQINKAIQGALSKDTHWEKTLALELIKDIIDTLYCIGMRVSEVIDENILIEIKLIDEDLWEEFSPVKENHETKPEKCKRAECRPRHPVARVISDSDYEAFLRSSQLSQSPQPQILPQEQIPSTEQIEEML